MKGALNNLMDQYTEDEEAEAIDTSLIDDFTL